MKLNSIWVCRTISCLSVVATLLFPAFLSLSVVQAQTTVSSFQSTNFPDRYIRHKGFMNR